MEAATMAFCRTSYLLLAILCVLRVQRGESIDASLQPVDPVIRVGGSLTLSCTLNHGNDNNRSSQSIQWTKSSSRIPASQYATPNVSTSLLHLHNVTIADEGKYFCQFEGDDEWSRPGVHVFIGTPPEPVENITCEAPNFTTFWCKWDNHHHHNTNLAVTDTLQFRPYGQEPWRTCRQTEQNRCEDICKDCNDKVEIRVISANVLGNTSLHEPILLTFLYIIRPDPVRDVSVTVLEPGCLTVTWQQPEGWDGQFSSVLMNSIRYRDLQHPTLHSPWTEVKLIFTDINYTLCQLRSYATYEVMISTSVAFNEDMKSWSKPVTATTQMTAPSAAPRNLTLNASSENPNWISVTWSPLDALEENGVVFGYLIYSCTFNASYPQTYVEESVMSSKDYAEWTSLFCLDETRVDNMNITPEEHMQDDLIEYTLINSEAGQSYLVWVSAINLAGEGPSTEPGMIALPTIPESSRRGRIFAMIVSAITICQLIFIIGLCLCCWQAGIDPFKRNRRLPQPYIPPDVLAMKQEALTPRPPCTGEFFNELCEYKEDKSLLEDQSQLPSTMVSNSGGSSVDHGFYDMQSSSSNSGSGSSSCSSSQYNSSHYHSVSTLSCSVNLTSNKQLVLMKDPVSGYSVATSVTDECEVPSESDNTHPSSIKNWNYGIEEEEEEDEDSDGYVNPNDVEPGTVGVSRIILKGNVYDKPTTRHRYQSSHSDTSTVLTSLSDQGFGSADSDPDSRQVSPTETTSPLFPELLPSKLDMLITNVDTKDKADYFGLDEIESICSSMASSRYRSSNGEDFPYRLPSITQYRRKSKSSNKSSGSESDIFSGYMSMATKEESDNDYGYVSKDHGSGSREGDEKAFVSSQEKDNAISTYDMSEFCSEEHSHVNKTMRTELFSNSSSGDILSGENRQSPICSTIPKPYCPSSTGSLPCSSVASSPNSIVSEIPPVLADRQNLIARDFEEEGLPSDLICGPALHPDSSDDHPGEGECGGKKDTYVSHVEATKMSAIQSRTIPETISKETPPGSSCRLQIEVNPPKKGSLRDILFTDPVSGYVSNAVFT